MSFALQCLGIIAMNPAYEALLESHKYIEILVGYLDSEDEVCHMAACDVLADLAI